MATELLTPEFVRNPWPELARLREHDPIHWDERYAAWVITRYADVAEGHKDSRLSSDRIGPYLTRLERDSAPANVIATFRVLADWMTFKDGGDHRRLRSLFSKAFTPRSVERMRERIAEITNELIDGIAGEQEVDFVERVAYPLPAIVISELLGVPPADRDRFKAWSDDITALVFGAAGEGDRHERSHVGMAQLVEYLEGRIAEARRSPGDDLVSGLVRAAEGSDGLSEAEIVSTCTLLLFGGHETTTNLLSGGTLCLLTHPEQAAQVAADPALEASAVEEMLRFEGPARLDVRIVGEPHELQGRELKPGQRVFLVVAAANRDPRTFDRPDEFDVTRKPNPHLTFGLGPHYCLGAPLARLEGQIAFPIILRRLPELALAAAPETLEWQPVLLSRALAQLPVRVGRVLPA